MTSWILLLVGLAVIAAGVGITLDPSRAAAAVEQAQRRSGRGPWSAPEQPFDGSGELGLRSRPGDRVRWMRVVGVGAVVVGLAVAIAAIVGFG